MHPMIETKRQQVAEICRRSGVVRLEVFGSAARDDFESTRSDIDFLVDLGNDPHFNPLDSYFALKQALEQVFERPVDLVSVGSIQNPYLKATINSDRQVVYAA